MNHPLHHELDPAGAASRTDALPAPLAHWRLLLTSVCLVLVFASRQTGALPGQAIRIADVVLVAAVLVLASGATPTSRSTDVVHGVVVALAILTAIVGTAIGSSGVQRIAAGITAYVLAASAFFLFRALVRQRHVSADTFFGAFAGYLAVGIMFATIYTLIARGDPTAFQPPQAIVDGQSDLYYFSFVTLTTLGYGDIAPASDVVRVLAPIEAVLGALIIAGLVGRIVGLLVAQATGSSN